MKRILFLVSFVSLSLISFSQGQYEVTVEGPDKILKGVISRDLVQKDSAFKWFGRNQNGYSPNAEALAALKAKSADVHFIVFGGTWCVDTQFLLPRFYALTDAASIPANHISLIGVDRNKKTLGNLTETLNIINVPTVIVLKNGKEVGRVVEYGKTGQWDKEIGEIVKESAN
ncbi:MAG TPA: thioredoxin family protein [Chitinophagaceae bacterium]